MVSLKTGHVNLSNDPLEIFSCGGYPVKPTVSPRASCVVNKDVVCQLSCVEQMLHLTQPNDVWRRPFLDLLQPCITEGDLRQTLAFLEHVIILAKEALHRHQQRTITHTSSRFSTRLDDPILLYVDTSLAPQAMSENQWKQLLIALGFEIEEPDGRHDISDVSVSVPPDAVLPKTLEGMLVLVELLADLPWQITGMVLRVHATDAVFLTSVLQSTDIPDDYHSRVRQLCGSYPDEMNSLGFRKTRSGFSRDHSPTADQLALVLKALFSETATSPGVFV